MLNKQLAASLAEHRARMARVQTMDEDALWREWEERHERQVRALEAQKRQEKRRIKRHDQPPPGESRMYAAATSCDAERDRRLSMGAKSCLRLIRALLKRDEKITKGGLAELMGRSLRTVQRYLSDLRACGYIKTWNIVNHIGWCVGQAMELAEKVLPFFLRPSFQTREAAEKRGIQGETFVSPIKSNIKPNQVGACGKLAGIGGVA